jgi:hypothetical protein
MPDTPNVAQVEDLAREYIERRGTESFKALLHSFGTSKLSQIDDRQRPLFYAKMQRLLQADADRLRDKFATAALQGMLASPSMTHSCAVSGIKRDWAEQAYQWADAMLAARLGK